MGTNLMRAVIVVSAICWAVGVAQAAATWLGQPYSVTVPTHISSVGQVVTSNSNLVLQHDAACDLIVTALVSGNEVLTSGGQTLSTAYMLTGADVSNPDGGWVPAATFVTRTYHVVGTGPNSTINIAVQATPPADRAQDAGAYSASIQITATW